MGSRTNGFSPWVKSLVLMDTFVGPEPKVTHKKYFDMPDAIEAVQHFPAPLVDTITPMFFARDAEQVNPELVARFRSSLMSFKGQRAVEERALACLSQTDCWRTLQSTSCFLKVRALQPGIG